MPTRTEIFLTPKVESLGRELAVECGSFKNAVSAGIIALARLSAEEQKKCVRMANGLDPIELSKSFSSAKTIEGIYLTDEELYTKILQILKDSQVLPGEKPHGYKTKTSKSG